ncbi:MAG: S-layer homology domain-containing protein [Eubacteriales bacterium]|nr:S-layer homology domain-containing protein [Eubacteriales bacterium]
MKKFVAMAVTMMILFSTMTVMASTEDINDAITLSSKGKGKAPVTFYVSRWGIQFDTEGNIALRDTIYFSDIVYSTNLNQKLDTTESIVIGDNVTEADILGKLNNEPQDKIVLKELLKEYKKIGALLYTNSGKLVSWDSFDEKNYGIMWYVLKNQADGWHVDGYVYDLLTGDTISIVLPEETKDFEDFIGKELDNDPDDDEVTDPEEPINDTSIHLEGAQYAYIFGYEPSIAVAYDEETDRNYTSVKIKMAMDDKVTREQVSAMLVRILDQAGYTDDKQFPMVDAVRPHAGQWYERGLLYLCSVGGFDSNKAITLSPVNRGEVAKLVSCALGLNLSSSTPFVDIDNNEYKEYIENVYHYGYMKGSSADTFEPNGVMTRAEFCSLFNNILDRNNHDLIAVDEYGDEYEITAEDYYFVDMSRSHWAYETCLKATSAYGEDGYVDVDTRNANVRNIIDQYEAQKKY